MVAAELRTIVAHFPYAPVKHLEVTVLTPNTPDEKAFPFVESNGDLILLQRKPQMQRLDYDVIRRDTGKGRLQKTVASCR